MKDDITDTRLCELIRREAARLGQERGAAGFKNSEVADAVLIEAMSIARGTAKQVQARVKSLVDEALHGPSWASPQEPPPDASPDEVTAYVDAMDAQAAALRAGAANLEELYREAERRGAGPDTPMRNVFTEEELAKFQLPKYVMRPAK